MRRFRANAYRQLRGVDAVFRFIPPKAPSLEELGLPEARSSQATRDYHQGMVLHHRAPPSCGKSSTLAALVNHINEEPGPSTSSPIEDPIEIIHPSKRCLVNQRHAGHRHTPVVLARAPRRAARGPRHHRDRRAARPRDDQPRDDRGRDRAISCWRRCIPTNAVRTVNRMIGAFPSERAGPGAGDALRVAASAVLSQRLVPTADEHGSHPGSARDASSSTARSGT